MGQRFPDFDRKVRAWDSADSVGTSRPSSFGAMRIAVGRAGDTGRIRSSRSHGQPANLANESTLANESRKRLNGEWLRILSGRTKRATHGNSRPGPRTNRQHPRSDPMSCILGPRNPAGVMKASACDEAELYYDGRRRARSRRCPFRSGYETPFAAVHAALDSIHFNWGDSWRHELAQSSNVGGTVGLWLCECRRRRGAGQPFRAPPPGYESQGGPRRCHQKQR